MKFQMTKILQRRRLCHSQHFSAIFFSIYNNFFFAFASVGRCFRSVFSFALHAKSRCHSVDEAKNILIQYKCLNSTTSCRSPAEKYCNQVQIQTKLSHSAVPSAAAAKTRWLQSYDAKAIRIAQQITDILRRLFVCCFFSSFLIFFFFFFFRFFNVSRFVLSSNRIEPYL